MIRHLVLAALAVFLLSMPDARSADADSVFAHPIDVQTLLETTLAAPARTLARAQVLQGAFTHERHMSEIRRPLTSTGEFTFARGLGVYWHTIKPFDSALVLTSSSLVQRDDGAQTLRLSSQEQPAVRMLADIFFALFTLDVRRLQQNFTLYAEMQDDRWVVGLKPTSAAVANAFSSAIVSGAAQVEQIVLIDQRGEHTVVTLQNVRATDMPPDAAVGALFAN